MVLSTEKRVAKLVRADKVSDSGQAPLGFAAGDANLYRYVGNSPTNATDPSGLEPPPSYPQIQRPGQRPVELPGFYKIPSAKEGGSITMPGSDFMKVHGVSRYNSIWPWDTSETDYFLQFKRGCIGLNALRLGLVDGKKSQVSLPGLRVFNNLKDALIAQAGHKDKKKTSILFAAQSKNNLDSFKDFLLLGSSTEYKPQVLGAGTLAEYNFATAIQNTNGDVVYWEYVNDGLSVNPTLETVHALKLPQSYKATFYAVVEVEGSRFDPPILNTR